MIGYVRGEFYTLKNIFFLYIKYKKSHLTTNMLKVIITTLNGLTVNCASHPKIAFDVYAQSINIPDI